MFWKIYFSLQNQVGEIRKVLKGDLRMNVVEIQNAKATLDGGDVLFTGKFSEHFRMLL